MTGPLLVVAPQSVLDAWEGDWHFWAGITDPAGAAAAAAAAATAKGSAGGAASGPLGHVNMVVYNGNATARTLLHDHELWLAPSSLDRKGSAAARGKDDFSAKVGPCWEQLSNSEPAAVHVVARRKERTKRRTRYAVGPLLPS